MTIQRLTNPGSKFYRESFRFLREKKRLRCKGYFSQLRHDFEILNGDNARNWVANLVLKFHDDPTVTESEIVVFLRDIWWSMGKERVLGERKGKKNEIERVSLKTNIAYLQHIIYLLF